MFNMEDLTEDVIPLESLKNKWKSFGWVVKKVDGHNVRSLFDALCSILLEKGKPSCIIAKNVKGRACIFMKVIVSRITLNYLSPNTRKTQTL